jgi:YD repeat-containing protein
MNYLLATKRLGISIAAKAFLILCTVQVGVVGAQVLVTTGTSEVWEDAGGNYSGYKSSAELLAAENAVSQAQFDKCTAYYVALGISDWECTKLVMTGIRPNLPTFPQFENGNYIFFIVNANFIAQGVLGGNPFSWTTPENDNFGVLRMLICPEKHGFGSSSVSLGDNSYQITCIKYLPPPAQCTRSGKSAGSGAPPRIGNPIELYDGRKTEFQTDYSDAREQTSFSREFLGQMNGWRFPGGSRIVDTYTSAISVETVGESYQGGTVDPTTGVNVIRIVDLDFPYLSSSQYGELYIINRDGSLSRFTATAPGVFQIDLSGTIVTHLTTPTAEGSVWRVQASDNSINEYGPDGALNKTQTADGRFLVYKYASGVLVQLLDNWGRLLRVTADPTGKPALIITPQGGQIQYAYQGNLVSKVTYEDGSSRQFLYNEPLYIGAGGQPAPYALTGSIDEKGVRTGSYYYDSYGTAIATEGAGGVAHYDVYSNSGAYATVNSPTGFQFITWFTNVNGVSVVSRQSQPAGSGCAASYSQLAYDLAGNILSADDFNGNRACYDYDLSRNVETVRVEGVGNDAYCPTYITAGAPLTSPSRKTTTLWHPDWRLPARTAEAGKLTTFVYNGQPDPFNANALASCAPANALLANGKPIAVPCKEVQQATIDIDGHLGLSAALQPGVQSRTTKWTYDSFGQKLTETDPLNNITTFAYYSDTSFAGSDPSAQGHTLGDLKTVTTALGQTTSYLLYNKSGQLIQQKDANGLTKTYSYDLRRRMLSSNVGGLMTSYSYDQAGLLGKITFPDTTSVVLSYDPAHRLTQVTDQAGNSVTYILDAAGNRIQEQIKNPSGTLARTVSRAFDALSRVQQVTGAAN